VVKTQIEEVTSLSEPTLRTCCAISDEEVERLLRTVALRVVRLLRKQGKLDKVNHPRREPPVVRRSSELGGATGAAASGTMTWK
jgi:hypothetical protein